MTPENARELYEAKFGPVTDEAWAEIAADVTDWDAFVAALDAPAAEEDAPSEEPCEHTCGGTAEDPAETIGAMQATIGELVATVETTQAQLASAVAQFEALSARQTELTASMQAQQRATEIAGTVLEVDGVSHRYAASAVEVLASVMSNPSAETAGELLAHINANGGRMCVVPVGEIGATLTPATKNDDDEYLASLGETDAVIGQIRGIMDKSKVGAREAASTFFRSLNPR